MDLPRVACLWGIVSALSMGWQDVNFCMQDCEELGRVET